MLKGHRAVDAAARVRDMNVARVAFHATNAEAGSWVSRQGSAPEGRKTNEHDLRAAWAASLEALGIRVEE